MADKSASGFLRCRVNSDWDVDGTCSYVLVLLLDIHDFRNKTVFVWEEKLTSHSNQYFLLLELKLYVDILKPL